MSRRTFLILLIIIPFFTYFASFSNPFIWDDEQFITSNIYVQQFDLAKILTENIDRGAGVVSNYYRPLTSLTFAIDAKIWGQNPFGFHFFNTGLHIAAGVFFFLLLVELGIGEWPSFFLALIFLLHPLQTEAVVYINSRGDSLFAALLFASFLLFWKALSEKGTYKKYIFAGLLFVAAVFSKETALAGVSIYPGLLVLHLLKTKKPWESLFSYKKELVFFSLLAGFLTMYSILRLTLLDFANTLNFYSIQNEYSRSLLVRLFTFCHVVWVYIGLLVWPSPLHMERTIPFVTSIFSPWVLGVLLLVLLLLASGVWEVQRRKTGYILFGFLFSATFLVPVSGVVPINGILYEHWLYVPLIGFFLMLYGIGKMLLKMIGYYAFIPITIRFVIILLCGVYGILTMKQNALWSDPLTFYRYTLSFAPTSIRLHNNLGMSLINAGALPQGIAQYQQALALGSNYPQVYNNLGNAYLVMGKYADAEQYLQKALQLSPQFGVAKLNLIETYIAEKKFDQAKKLAAGDSQLVHEIETIEHQQ